MKHTACGGVWEIRTDPKTTEYVVVEGARKRDYGPEEKEARAEMAFLSEAEREKRRNDAFAGLEGRIEEQGLEKKQKERVDELYEAALGWEDPYTANSKLRKVFRARRKVLEKEEDHKGSIQNKFSLGIDIVDELDSDKLRAKLVDFDVRDAGEDEAARKPLFVGENNHTTKEMATTKTRKLKHEMKTEKTRLELRHTLLGNTRAAINPFSSEATSALKGSTRAPIALLKRKRGDDSSLSLPGAKISPTALQVSSETPNSHHTNITNPEATRMSPMSGDPPVVLVGYESD